MSDNLLIIGWGNPMRGDDAAGPAAAERLARRGFETVAVHQLVPELAERIASAGTVIFLDADGAVPPGEIEIEPLAEAGAARTFEHHASPAGLLRLAHVAYGARPAACLIRMGAAGFDFGEGLSRAAEQAVGLAVATVEIWQEELAPSRR